MGADRQAQTRSPVFASMRAVGLTEWLKDQLLLVDGNSHAGVDYSEMHEIAARFAPNFDAHGSGVGKFDRVAQKIQQYLAQAVAISHHPQRYVRTDLVMQIETLLLGWAAESIDSAIDALT